MTTNRPLKTYIVTRRYVVTETLQVEARTSQEAIDKCHDDPNADWTNHLGPSKYQAKCDSRPKIAS